MELPKIKAFEKDIIEKIKSEKPDVLETVQSSGKLDENSETAIKQAIEDYKKGKN